MQCKNLLKDEFKIDLSWIFAINFREHIKLATNCELQYVFIWCVFGKPLCLISVSDLCYLSKLFKILYAQMHDIRDIQYTRLMIVSLICFHFNEFSRNIFQFYEIFNDKPKRVASANCFHFKSISWMCIG